MFGVPLKEKETKDIKFDGCRDGEDLGEVGREKHQTLLKYIV